MIQAESMTGMLPSVARTSSFRQNPTVRALMLANGGASLISSGTDRTIRFWDLQNGGNPVKSSSYTVVYPDGTPGGMGGPKRTFYHTTFSNGNTTHSPCVVDLESVRGAEDMESLQATHISSERARSIAMCSHNGHITGLAAADQCLLSCGRDGKVNVFR